MHTDRAKAIAEWKATNGYDDLLNAYVDAVSKARDLEAALRDAKDLLQTMWSDAAGWSGERASSHFRSAMAERLRAIGVKA